MTTYRCKLDKGVLTFIGVTPFRDKQGRDVSELTYVTGPVGVITDAFWCVADSRRTKYKFVAKPGDEVWIGDKEPVIRVLRGGKLDPLFVSNNGRYVVVYREVGSLGRPISLVVHARSRKQAVDVVLHAAKQAKSAPLEVVRIVAD